MGDDEELARRRDRGRNVGQDLIHPGAPASQSTLGRERARACPQQVVSSSPPYRQQIVRGEAGHLGAQRQDGVVVGQRDEIELVVPGGRDESGHIPVAVGMEGVAVGITAIPARPWRRSAPREPRGRPPPPAPA